MATKMKSEQKFIDEERLERILQSPEIQALLKDIVRRIIEKTNKPICGMPKFERNHSDNIKDTYFCHLTADDIEEMHEQVQKGVGEFLIRIREVKE